MKFALLSVIALLSVPTALAVDAPVDAVATSPVTRIVDLLSTLKESTLNTGKAEQQMYDKYACWCEKTSKRKADDIVQGQNDLRSLGQRILKLKGRIATRTAEIAELTSNIESNEEMQAQITAVREKENAAWVEESDETKQALAALQDAITVLADATTPGKSALIQENQQMRSRYAVNAVLQKLPSRVGLSHERMALLSEFTSAKNGYAPQSATIQGMLADMYLTFANNLQSATSDEGDKNEKFEQLYATLEKENNEYKATRARKETEKAEAEAMLADTTKAYEDTEKQLEADKEFFDQTKAACESKHEEWVEREKLRNEELEGIDAALVILTSDKSRELFASAIKPGVESFLQIASRPSSLLQSSSMAPAARAYNALKAQVKKSHSMRLAALAVKIRTAKFGHFDGVIKAIDEMLTTLQKEGASDLAKKTQCLDEYQNIESTVKDLDWKIKNNLAQIAKLEELIKLREEDKDKANQKIKETNEYIDDIEADRKAEHEEYKEAKRQDEAAIKTLEAAKKAFQAYFKKNDIKMGKIQGSVKGAFAQEDPVFAISQDQAPDATFSKKGNNKLKSKDVVSLFEYIIEDLSDEIANEDAAEAKSQAEYEEERATAEKLVSDLEEQVVTLEGIIAKRQDDKTAEKKTMSENNNERDDELAYQAKITPDCDWIMKAFDQRAEARAAEEDGLTTAKEFLAGQVALLEKSKESPKERLGFLGFSH